MHINMYIYCIYRNLGYKQDQDIITHIYPIVINLLSPPQGFDIFGSAEMCNEIVAGVKLDRGWLNKPEITIC